jgi:integrase
LMLTGQRRSEVSGMSWAELDRAASTWTIPADRAKNGVAQIVPLSATATAELDGVADTAKDKEVKSEVVNWPKAGFVFTTTGKTPISGLTKAKIAIDAAITKARGGDEGEVGAVAGPLPAWRIHDLRRTLATGFQRLGIRFEVTEAVLNHVSGAKGGIAGIYQRHDWKEEKRSALDAWSRHVASIIKHSEQGDNVAILQTRRTAH